MHPVSCINTHHEVIGLENHEMIKNAKIWISWNRNINFLQNKEILNLRLRWHILRSYRFVSEWTFNNGSTRHCSGVFIVHFWYVWHVILVHFFCWLWTCKCWMEYFIALISIYLCFGVGSRSPVTFKTECSVTTVNTSSQLLPFSVTKSSILDVA